MQVCPFQPGRPTTPFVFLWWVGSTPVLAWRAATGRAASLQNWTHAMEKSRRISPLSMFSSQLVGNTICPDTNWMNFPIFTHFVEIVILLVITCSKLVKSYSDSVHCTFFPLYCLHQEIASYFSFGLTGNIPLMWAGNKIKRSQILYSVPGKRQPQNHKVSKLDQSLKTTSSRNEELGPKEMERSTVGEPPANSQTTQPQEQEPLGMHPPLSSWASWESDLVFLPDYAAEQTQRCHNQRKQLKGKEPKIHHSSAQAPQRGLHGVSKPMDEHSKSLTLNLSLFSSENPRKQLWRATTWEFRALIVARKCIMIYNRHLQGPFLTTQPIFTAHYKNASFMDWWEIEFCWAHINSNCQKVHVCIENSNTPKSKKGWRREDLSSHCDEHH